MDDKQHTYAIGKTYFIRTATHAFVGELHAVYEHELVLVKAAWIAETGRFTQAVKDGKFEEVEPYPADTMVIIGRGSLIDASESPAVLPMNQNPPLNK